MNLVKIEYIQLSGKISKPDAPKIEMVNDNKEFFTPFKIYPILITLKKKIDLKKGKKS